MAQRTLKQLYEIVLQRTIDKKDTEYGICNQITRCYSEGKISLGEKLKLYNDFIKRKPTFFTFAYWNPSYRKLSENIGEYWWDQTLSGNKARITFLRRIIRSL